VIKRVLVDRWTIEKAGAAWNSRTPLPVIELQVSIWGRLKAGELSSRGAFDSRRSR
jgi:hypothetical protein